ncbi:MAG TPA: glycosyltransferase family 9 protein, partial [Longimicrobiales bacterium]|nr:glycosyltransferase family 9 protein [Longimicrobiales bacterium]
MTSALARRLADDPPREICVVMLSALGDAVHVLPVVNALKRRWPRVRITWIVQPVPHALVRGHPSVDELVVFRRRRGPGAWRGFAEIARRLRERRFDVALGLQVYFKAGLLTHLVPARTRLGFDRRRARDGQWLFTDERIPDRGERHVQDQYFEFLEHLGVDPEPVEWHLRLGYTPEERAARDAFFRELDAPACAVVVGTSRPAKNWTAEGWARVVEVVEERHGLRPVLVGGPSSEERAVADRI